MTAARVATVTAVGAVLAWGAKAVAIGLAGGLDKSPAESPLFFLGLVLYVIAAPAIGVALTARRSTGTRVLGGVAGFCLGLLLFVITSLAIAPFKPDNPFWVWEELNLWIVSVLTAAGWLVLRSRIDGRETHLSGADR